MRSGSYGMTARATSTSRPSSRPTSRQESPAQTEKSKRFGSSAASTTMRHGAQARPSFQSVEMSRSPRGASPCWRWTTRSAAYAGRRRLGRRCDRCSTCFGACSRPEIKCVDHARQRKNVTPAGEGLIGVDRGRHVAKRAVARVCARSGTANFVRVPRKPMCRQAVRPRRVPRPFILQTGLYVSGTSSVHLLTFAQSSWFASTRYISCSSAAAFHGGTCRLFMVGVMFNSTLLHVG